MGKTQRGRGRGKGRGGRAGQPGGRGTAATSAASNDGQQPAAGQQQVPSGEALRMTLQAKPDILSSLKESGCPAQVVEDATTLSTDTVTLTMATWNDLEPTLAWFRDTTDKDTTASLSFSPHLSKNQRATVHKLSDATGLGALESVSAGIGDQRTVKAVRKGTATKVELSDDDEERAVWLRRWAAEKGRQLSVDEAREMIMTGELPNALRAMWVERLATQKAVAGLCTAVASGDVEGVSKVLVEAAVPIQTAFGTTTTGTTTGTAKKGKGTTNTTTTINTRGVYDERTGDGPLHLAAAAGRVDIIKLLLDGGVGVDSVDSRGLSALVVARKCEQSDVEGVLLRCGAHDPDADTFLGGGADSTTAADTTTAIATGNGTGKEEEENNKQQKSTTIPTTTTKHPAAPASVSSTDHPLSEEGEGGCNDSLVNGGGGTSNLSVCGTDISMAYADVASAAGDYMDADYIAAAAAGGGGTIHEEEEEEQQQSEPSTPPPPVRVQQKDDDEEEEEERVSSSVKDRLKLFDNGGIAPSPMGPITSGGIGTPTAKGTDTAKGIKDKDTVGVNEKEDSSTSIDTKGDTVEGGGSVHSKTVAAMHAARDELDVVWDQCMDWMSHNSTMVLTGAGVVAAVTSAVLLYRRK